MDLMDRITLRHRQPLVKVHLRRRRQLRRLRGRGVGRGGRRWFDAAPASEFRLP
jgi:hypothetical protein